MAISLTAAALPREAEELRTEVRGFLADELMRGSFVPRCDSWLSGIDTAFSRKLGKQVWLGATRPPYRAGQVTPSQPCFPSLQIGRAHV